MIYPSFFERSCVPSLFYPFPKDCPNLIGVAFEFMKRIPAQFCVERALRPVGLQSLGADGMFGAAASADEEGNRVFVASKGGERGHLFLETSSGNMATGMAEVCQEHDVPLCLLLPYKVDQVTRNSLIELGAEVEIIGTTDQNMRIQRLLEIKKLREEQGWTVTWVQQYTNLNNRLSYWRLAEFLASELDRIDQLVAAVGTGGSSCGTADYLRKAGFPELKLVAVDACGSVNFCHKPGEFLLGGIGSSRPMPLVDHTAFDTVHWIDDSTAFAASISLFKEGVPVGGSSAAAYLAARHEAEKAPDDIVLVIFPDHARRYADTIRSDAWRRDHGIDLALAKPKPIQVSCPAKSDPSNVERGWYRIDWRSYHDARSGTQGATDGVGA